MHTYSLRSLGFQKDLAVIELAQKVTFDDYKRPAALALSDTKYRKGLTNFEVTGWGTKHEKGNSHSKLMLTTVPYKDFDECKTTYAKLGLPYAKVRPGMICAGICNVQNLSPVHFSSKNKEFIMRL